MCTPWRPVPMGRQCGTTCAMPPTVRPSTPGGWRCAPATRCPPQHLSRTARPPSGTPTSSAAPTPTQPPPSRPHHPRRGRRNSERPLLCNGPAHHAATSDGPSRGWVLAPLCNPRSEAHSRYWTAKTLLRGVVPTQDRSALKTSSPKRQAHRGWHLKAKRPAFPLVAAGLVGLAGLEPAASSLSAITRLPLCNPAFLQVVPDRRGPRYAFNQPTGMRSCE